jgi:hypothetical protein
MEKIIASSQQPVGKNKEVLDYLEEHQDLLSLNEAIIYYGFPVFNNYEG